MIICQDIETSRKQQADLAQEIIAHLKPLLSGWRATRTLVGPQEKARQMVCMKSGVLYQINRHTTPKGLKLKILCPVDGDRPNFEISIHPTCYHKGKMVDETGMSYLDFDTTRFLEAELFKLSLPGCIPAWKVAQKAAKHILDFQKEVESYFVEWLVTPHSPMVLSKPMDYYDEAYAFMTEPEFVKMYPPWLKSIEQARISASFCFLTNITGQKANRDGYGNDVRPCAMRSVSIQGVFSIKSHWPSVPSMDYCCDIGTSDTSLFANFTNGTVVRTTQPRSKEAFCLTMLKIIEERVERVYANHPKNINTLVWDRAWDF